MVITFEELRNLKDSMPPGSLKKIAEQLDIDVDTVRNYFGGDHYEKNPSFSGVHFEKGMPGGVVELKDTNIYDIALRISQQAKAEAE